MPRLPEGWTIRDGVLVRVTVRACTVLQFMSRLSEEEQVALGVLRINTAVPYATRSTLNLLAETRDNVTNKQIRFDDPRTARGVDISLWSLSTLIPEGTPGHIAPADVAARKAAWLADWPQPGEGLE